MVPNMKAKYTAEVAPALMKKFQYERNADSEARKDRYQRRLR